VTVSEIRLLVDDFHGCFAFLRDSLGLECTFGGEDDGYASFEADAGKLAVFRRDDQSQVVELRARADGTLTVLEVDDVAAEAAKLGDAVVGGPVSKAAWGGRVAYVRDPGGNLLERVRAAANEE
jgi:lactoylglutathione lyase